MMNRIGLIKKSYESGFQTSLVFKHASLELTWGMKFQTEFNTVFLQNLNGETCMTLEHGSTDHGLWPISGLGFVSGSLRCNWNHRCPGCAMTIRVADFCVFPYLMLGLTWTMEVLLRRREHAPHIKGIIIVSAICTTIPTTIQSLIPYHQC
jgi:hypothetical protein